jgi:hypothetical protein
LVTRQLSAGPLGSAEKHTIMNMIVKLVQIFGLISIALAVLIICDLVLPSQVSDSVIVIDKQVSKDVGGKYNPSFGLLKQHLLFGKGKFTSVGDVKYDFFETVNIGDKLVVHYSRIFHQWKRVELIDRGSVVRSDFTKDIIQSVVGIFILLVPIYSFREKKYWLKGAIFWVGYGISLILAIALWTRFIMFLFSSQQQFLF